MSTLTDSEEAPHTALSDAFSSEVPLQVDSEPNYLGPTKAKEISSATPRVDSRDLGDMGIRVTVTHLEHGRYDSKPAALIAFKSRFLFDSIGGSSRFTKAEIRVVFDVPREGKRAREAAESSSLSPSVVRFCPALIQGQPTRVTVSNTLKARIDASLGPAEASVAGVGASGGYLGRRSLTRTIR